MTQTIINEVRRGHYADSVALMRLSQQIVGMDGVEEAALMMGSPANIEILADANLLSDAGREAEGGDLIIAIRATGQEQARHAAEKAVELLAQSAPVASEQAAWRPKTLRAAVGALPDANFALISVPGDFAIAEARKAIRRGLDVMIFSDNVAIEEEATLKREAHEIGRLVMGPDCGTAIINGTPLAFANKVKRGSIGIVGASGTGIQEVSCLIDRFGGGISHAIGVGGRDLSREVGGLSTLMALDMLAEDAGTEHLVLISKPPPEDVAATVLKRIADLGKPATVCFLGSEEGLLPRNATHVTTLGQAARHAVGADDAAAPAPPLAIPAGARRIHGLFSGGTLCAEAQIIFRAGQQAFFSNAPIPGAPTTDESPDVHALLDLGADEYTRGRPHPMIDPAVRDRTLLDALATRETALVLLDIVIGYGAHADPAGYLVDLLAANPQPDRPPIVASVTGTDADPQNRAAQVARLEAAGIHVAPTNADAASWAIAAVKAGR